MHALRRQDAAVLLPVGAKSHTSMEEDLQTGPHIEEVVGAPELQHTAQHRQHPAGHTAQIGDILGHHLACYALALLLKVAQQGSGLAGHPHHIHHRIDVFDKDGTEVAHKAVREVIVGCMASAQDEGLAVEYAALGIIAQIPHHRIRAAPVMGVVEAVPAHGDELAFVAGGAAAFGIPFHRARPENIRLALPHPFDIRLELLIGVHGMQPCKLFVAFHLSVLVHAPPLCVRPLPEQG